MFAHTPLQYTFDSFPGALTDSLAFFGSSFSNFIHNPPTCKQFNFPEWINVLYYIHTMGYYAAIQRNKLTIQAKTWINLKSILLNEKKLNPKTSYCVISIIWHSEKGKIISSRTKGLQERIFFGGREVTELCCVFSEVVVTWLYAFVKLREPYSKKKQISL